MPGRTDASIRSRFLIIEKKLNRESIKQASATVSTTGGGHPLRGRGVEGDIGGSVGGSFVDGVGSNIGGSIGGSVVGGGSDNCIASAAVMHSSSRALEADDQSATDHFNDNLLENERDYNDGGD